MTSFKKIFISVSIIMTVSCGFLPGSGKHDETVVISSDPFERPDGWLYTEGNKIHTSDGEVWYGRGVNIHDTRSNWECSYQAPDPELVKAQIDEAVDVWGADFLRLCLETDPSSGPYQYRGILDDPEYLEDVLEIIDYIGTKEDVYVLLSLWVEPTTNSVGWPTDETIPVWERLAEELQDVPYVIYGIINEPHGENPSQDQTLWAEYEKIVTAIRAVEIENESFHHLIAVQGTRGWSRILEYYIDHPISVAGGQNIVYETHAYVPQSQFEEIVEIPSQTLPVIIGEYGPAYMSLADCGDLFELAQELKIPLAAWSFHSTAGPTLLEYYGKPDSCSPSGQLTPTPLWGNLIKTALSSDYESPLVRDIALSSPSIFNNTSPDLTISAEVTDIEGSVSSVSIDLSAVGADSNAAMTHSSGNTWSVTRTIPAGAAAGQYMLTVSAVDNEGNSKHRVVSISVIEPASSDLVIYSEGTDVREWTWPEDLAEDTSVYYDGSESLRLDFSFSNYWAGFGFYINPESGTNLMGYSALEVAYRAENSASVPVSAVLSDLSGSSSQAVDLGPVNSDFDIIQIPLSSFSGINLYEVNGFTFQVYDGSTPAAEGTIWIDNIRIIP